MSVLTLLKETTTQLFKSSLWNSTYKKRLIFHSLSHQYDQQFEQKYETKRDKSGKKVEKSLELMLSQCCESSLTCSSPPSCREKRGETRADREKSLQKLVVANEPSRGENERKRDGGALESSVSCLYRTHSGLSISPRENSFHSPNRPNPTRSDVSKHPHKFSNSNW